MSLTDLRRNYTLDTLSESQLTVNPLTLFDKWLQQVIDEGIPDPNAMTLATVNGKGRPSQRIVLLKGRPDNNFVFYTNYESNKALDIESNNQVSLHFPWYVMERQVMVLGRAYKLSSQHNDEYFAVRPKPSQIGALVSMQSKPLQSRESLVSDFVSTSKQFQDHEVPRPEHWGGYCVKPQEIEFWQGGEHRLHDRFRYTQTSDGQWQVNRLNP